MVAIHQLRKRYQIGDRVRIGDVEGPILDITQTAVVIDDATGKAHVPAHRFADDVSTLLTPSDPS
ncbi:MAG: mechanosensitive ion channel [Verrucomicrobia bacterium]|nr:mechanosensitive ion channel [Verrucomicrobiota bacterium]